MKISQDVKILSKLLLNTSLNKTCTTSNFIALLCNGTTNASITKQEVVYVFFIDPDSMHPTLELFEYQTAKMLLGYLMQ